MKIGYVRSNGHGDDYKVQSEVLLEAGCERIFEDMEGSKLNELDRPPRVLLSASGIHYYPFKGGGEFDELGSAGEGFL